MHRNWSLFEYNETSLFDFWHGVHVAGCNCTDCAILGVGCVSLCAGARANDCIVFAFGLCWGKVMISLPNWVHNSGKKRKPKGCCKGVIKARKQALRALKVKLAANSKVR